MFNIKYSLIIFFAIALIIMLWIIFTSFSEKTISTPTNSQSFVDIDNSYEIAASTEDSRKYIPRDNDASYSLPAYIPTHNYSMPRKKIEFNETRDNDELYYTPVEMPKNAPKRTITRQAPAAPTPETQSQYIAPPAQPPVYQAPAQPVAPLQPQAPQPEAPTYVPQYQQYQQPAYQAPAAQQPQTEQEEYYPYYYY